MSATPADTASLRTRNLALLGGLAGLFFLPVAIAFWMYYGSGWRPGGHSNHGTLISPARPLPRLALPRLDAPPGTAWEGFGASRHWSLVYIGGGECAADCRATLYVMRQARLALNQEMPRVERVYLVTGENRAQEFLAREHPGLIIASAASASAAPLLAAFPAEGQLHTLYVVDPLGNLMMSYDARVDPRGLLLDLQKLLKLSHIG